MSRLFRHKSVSARMSSSTMPLDDNSESGYSSLLESNVNDVSPQSSTQQQHRQTKSSSGSWGYSGFTMHQEPASRPWLGTAESRTSWSGERQPPRKLVKEHQNGSGRPSFSLELSDSDGENKEKGIVRRQIDRLRQLYQREKSKMHLAADIL